MMIKMINLVYQDQFYLLIIRQMLNIRFDDTYGSQSTHNTVCKYMYNLLVQFISGTFKGFYSSSTLKKDFALVQFRHKKHLVKVGSCFGSPGSVASNFWKMSQRQDVGSALML